MSSLNMSCKEMSRRAATRDERAKEDIRLGTPGKRSSVARFRNAAKPPNVPFHNVSTCPIHFYSQDTEADRSRFHRCGKAFGLRPDSGRVHTPTMTLKNAALLALIETILMTSLLVWTFVFNFLNLLRGLVPAVTLFSLFIYAVGCFSVMVFFYVFHRAQKS